MTVGGVQPLVHFLDLDTTGLLEPEDALRVRVDIERGVIGEVAKPIARTRCAPGSIDNDLARRRERFGGRHPFDADRLEGEREPYDDASVDRWRSPRPHHDERVVVADDLEGTGNDCEARRDLAQDGRDLFCKSPRRDVGDARPATRFAVIPSRRRAPSFILRIRPDTSQSMAATATGYLSSGAGCKG